jgi:2-dehydro-3-deoxygluconokinase
MRAAAVGECMIELRETADGRITRSWGGDTLNTAVYLARLGVAVDYVTALGDDAWSQEMISGWRAEGVGTDLVQTIAGRLPGLYVIQTDVKGERRFLYWRDSAPARDLFDLPQTPVIAERLSGYDVIYLSGITLSLFGVSGRQRLFDALAGARRNGRQIVFDTNFRPRGWPDRAVAETAYRSAFSHATTILASVEDLELLFGAGREAEVLDRAASAEVVLKLAEPACRVFSAGSNILVAGKAADQVIDTTAAGDSFAAAYLAARMAGANAEEAARAGHRLAGVVVRYSGAIIPLAAMPDNVIPGRSAAEERQR